MKTKKTLCQNSDKVNVAPESDGTLIDGRYLAIRVERHVMMAPTLYTGDVVLVDVKGKPAQGQLVLVEGRQPRQVIGWKDGRAIMGEAHPWFTTVRRCFEFAGVAVYVADGTDIPQMLEFRRAWPVVKIGFDELSDHAMIPRPDESECRLAAVRRAAGSMQIARHSAAKKAAAALVKKWEAEAAARSKAWKHPAGLLTWRQ